jgi:tRNA-Thr(GGU) m(6)t(6)A37 methyltransferase TsaA
MPPPNLTLHPIGTVATPYSSKYAAPRQPATARKKCVGVIKLNPGSNFEQALEDLDGFEYVWILYWFDRNTTWKPKVLPPTEQRIKRGVFATRSPHRPNPLGLSLCKLIDVRGRTIRIEDPDMLDGTPVLDIKPYLPHAEAFPEARAGWVALSHERASERFRVVYDVAVREHLETLPIAEREEITAYLSSVLARDPFPHVYRRIRILGDGSSVVAVKRWRFSFTVHAANVRITSMYREGDHVKRKAARRDDQKR